MTVEAVMAVCDQHKACKDCPYYEFETSACVFVGTPNTWDPYGHDKESRDAHLVDKAYPEKYNKKF